MGSAEAAPGGDLQRQVAHAHRITSTASVSVEEPDDRLGIHTDSVVEAEVAQSLSELPQAESARTVPRGKPSSMARRIIASPSCGLIWNWTEPGIRAWQRRAGASVQLSGK